MSEIIILLAVVGAVAAGLWDLKTTEVPDEIPALMATLGIIYWFVSAVSTGDAYPFFVSVISAAAIGLAGYALYRSGKWGGADAFIFAAISAMVPVNGGRIFLFDYAGTLIMVSGAYVVVYTLLLGAMKPRVFAHFSKDLEKTWPYVIMMPLFYFAFIYAVNIASSLAILYGLLLTMLVLFWRYALVMEKKLFRKKIAVSRLKEGDVLEKMIWRGLTKEEIREIKRKEKYVIVKEGVRFVPAFAIALVLTLLYGNILLLIFPL